MNITKREFIKRTGVLGIASLVVAAPAAAAEKADPLSSSVFNVRDFGAKGERSCQIRLEECNGLTFVSNTCAAGRDDGDKGKYTPQVGFILRKLNYSIIANNVGCPME